MSALVALLLLGAPAEEESYKDLARRFEAAAPEPEPPPGLRAPEDSERRRKAVALYQRLLADWRAAEEARRGALVAACTRHLERFPAGTRRLDVLYLRGATRLQAGDHAGAKADLEAYLAAGGLSVERRALRGALVACCRALGDYAAAVRHAGRHASPDLLEEAGLVDRAIESAKARGESAKAAQWALIGKPHPDGIRPPAGVGVLVLAAGEPLPEEVRKGLESEFSKKNLAFRFTSGRIPAIYLLDEQGTVRGVNPRADTLTYRIRHILRDR